MANDVWMEATPKREARFLCSTTLHEDLKNSPPLGIAPTDKPLGLPLQVVLVLATQGYTATVHTSVERNSGGSMSEPCQ